MADNNTNSYTIANLIVLKKQRQKCWQKLNGRQLRNLMKLVLELCFVLMYFTNNICDAATAVKASDKLQQTAANNEMVDTRFLLRQKRVINGRLVQHGEYPWVVALQAKPHSGWRTIFFAHEEHYCGGTLIAPDWVLTASHCLYSETDDGQITSLINSKIWHARIATAELKPSFGERVEGLMNRMINTLTGHQRMRQAFYHVQKIIPHPKYKPGVLEYDIALFKLKETPNLEKILGADVLPLPQGVANSHWPKEGEFCTIVGWGCSVAGGPLMSQVQAAQLPVLNADHCRSLYVSNINLTDAHEFCAGYRKGQTGICPGDSGGPLACTYNNTRYLAGVVSATHRVKPADYPALFTRVSYFTDWIRSTMKQYPSKVPKPSLYLNLLDVFTRRYQQKMNASKQTTN